QCLEKLTLFTVRTFDHQIAPLRCGSGCAAITNLRLVNLWYNNSKEHTNRRLLPTRTIRKIIALLGSQAIIFLLLY
ncbi:MAG: hypothetical protein RR162_04790, partial [Oscillospiraceae bacterium]